MASYDPFSQSHLVGKGFVAVVFCKLIKEKIEANVIDITTHIKHHNCTEVFNRNLTSDMPQVHRLQMALFIFPCCVMSRVGSPVSYFLSCSAFVSS